MTILFIVAILIFNPIIAWLLMHLVDNTIGVYPDKLMGGLLVISIFMFSFSLEVSLTTALIKMFI